MAGFRLAASRGTAFSHGNPACGEPIFGRFCRFLPAGLRPPGACPWPPVRAIRRAAGSRVSGRVRPYFPAVQRQTESRAQLRPGAQARNRRCFLACASGFSGRYPGLPGNTAAYSGPGPSTNRSEGDYNLGMLMQPLIVGCGLRSRGDGHRPCRPLERRGCYSARTCRSVSCLRRCHSVVRGAILLSPGMRS